MNAGQVTILQEGKQRETYKEKTFKVLWLFTRVFSPKYGGMVSFGSTSKQSMKIFSMKVFQERLTDWHVNVFY